MCMTEPRIRNVIYCIQTFLTLKKRFKRKKIRYITVNSQKCILLKDLSRSLKVNPTPNNYWIHQ